MHRSSNGIDQMGEVNKVEDPLVIDGRDVALTL